MMDHLTRTELMEKFVSVTNYAILIGMLSVSALIGIYFWRKGQSSAEETLVGGRSMSVLPITASLAATFMSAITLLGLPAEIYTQGTQMLMILCTLPIMSFFTSELYMPLFHNLQVQSTYEYLEWRFNSTVKVTAGTLFTLKLLLYIAIVVYMPALALEQMTGVDVDLSCALIFIVCVFYTSVGGIKAVVWTDVFQLFFMFLSSITVLVLATSEAGGAAKVWDTNYQDGRIQLFNLSPDVRERHTLYGTTLGYGLMWLSVFGVSQTQIQRYLSLPTIDDARKAVKLTFIVMLAMMLMMGWLGLVLYTIYSSCDPITAKQVRKKDQILPLLVLHVAGDIPGLPGLFIAGVFSGSLSSISSGLNSLAAIALRDFIPAKHLNNMSDVKKALLTKVFSLLFGVIGYGTTFLIRFMPGMLEAAVVIGGVSNGPIFGVFTIGMLIPWVNSTGIMVGFVGSLVLTSWIAVGGTVFRGTYTSLTSPPLPSNLSGCPHDWMVGNMTFLPKEATSLTGHIPLYDISYVWYCLIGLILIVVFSLVTTIFTSQDIRLLDKKLLSPAMARAIYGLPECRIRRCMVNWYENIGQGIPDITKKETLTLDSQVSIMR